MIKTINPFLKTTRPIFEANNRYKRLYSYQQDPLTAEAFRIDHVALILNLGIVGYFVYTQTNEGKHDEKNY